MPTLLTDFERLLQAHRVILERYIHFRMQNTSDAEDVIQETCLAALRNFGQLRDQARFKPWLLKIASNQCNLCFRRRCRDASDSLDDSLPIEADLISQIISRCDVRAVLARMPEEMRCLLTAYYLEDRSLREIADRLAIPTGTVKSRLHAARERFRILWNEINPTPEKGEPTMPLTRNFPLTMPKLTLVPLNIPYTPIRCEDESFIIPRIGNTCSEGTYRYPDKNLALVSTCRVTGKAYIHDVEGVQICRDTYNLRADKLYKNEKIWFDQLTDDYIRSLATLDIDEEGEYPTCVHTFLEEDYDVIVNGNDRVHGLPTLIAEHPVTEDANGLQLPCNERCTMGMWQVTVGNRSFDCVKVVRLQMHTLFTESYIDTNGRMVLLRWYETEASVENCDNYPPAYRAKLKNNAVITANGEQFVHIEDRISEYAL